MSSLSQYTWSRKERIWSVQELQCILYQNIPDDAMVKYEVSRSSNVFSFTIYLIMQKGEYGVCRSSIVLSITIYLIMQRESMKYLGAPISSLSQYTWSCRGIIRSVQELQWTLYHNTPDYEEGEYEVSRSSNVLSFTIYLIMQSNNMDCPGA